MPAITHSLTHSLISCTCNCIVRHRLVQARTGTGKTLVFLLPILNRLLSIRTTRADGTRGSSQVPAYVDLALACLSWSRRTAIIIAPTRELAAQIHDVLCALAKPFAWIVPGLLTGGMSRNKEVRSYLH